MTPAFADCVVLLHGLKRSENSLWLMDKALEQAGYKTVNSDYPSSEAPIEELAEVPAHFVKFDMGLIRGIDSASERKRKVVGDLVRLVCEVAGSRKPFGQLPAGLLWPVAIGMETAARLAPGGRALGWAAPCSAPRTNCVVSRARARCNSASVGPSRRKSPTTRCG